MRWFPEGYGPSRRISFEGLTVEKPSQAESWVDVQLGRAQSLANAKEMQQSIGFLRRRHAREFDGIRGRLKAKLRSIRKIGDDVSITLSVEDTVEGTVTVRARLTGDESMEEFFDYLPNDLVELDATVHIPLPPPRQALPPLPNGSRPTPVRSIRRTECSM